MSKMSVLKESTANADGVFAMLSEYVETHERTAPVAFVGRDDILKDLVSGARIAGKGSLGSGMTRVIEGIPGAGKTSVSREFVSRNQGRDLEVSIGDIGSGEKKTCALFCLELQATDLDTPPLNFVRGIYRAWEKHCLGFSEGTGKFARGHVGKMADIVSLGLNRNTEQERIARINALSEHSTLGDCISAYCDCHWGHEVIIALCIDEAQMCPATANSRKIVMGLHAATHEGKIAQFFFGLPGTKAHLADRKNGLGISRINARCQHEICLLEPGEPKEVAKRTLDRLGLSWESEEWRGYISSRGYTRATWESFRGKIEDAVADGSSRFPQHITLGLEAACQSIIAHRGDLSPRTGAEILREVRGMHEFSKEAYYRERLQGVEPHAAAFGAICRKAKQSRFGAIYEYEAKRAISAGRSSDEQNLSSEQAGYILKNALDKGVLAKSKKGLIAPPSIPSMSAYLETELQEDLDASAPHAIRAAKALGLSAPADPSEKNIPGIAGMSEKPGSPSERPGIP